MKTLALLMALFLLAGVVMPAAAAFVSYQRTENPCGMVFCCCPRMCKMLKHKKLVGQACDGRNCGINSASSADILFPSPLAELRIMIVSGVFTDSHPRNSILRPDAWQPFDSAVRFPLDKPPPFLS